MDELARHNKAAWEGIAGTRMQYTRPFLDLTPAKARAVVDAQGVLGDVAGKKVLCLAAGGGQQSAAFGLLGADVTVLDLSDTQLERDREAAAHYNLAITALQGDMRDLSRFADDSFDVVWQAFSINFVPEVRPVLAEVARVVRLDGLYHLDFHNPFTVGMDDLAWDGNGYPMQHPYVDGVEVSKLFPPYWEVECEDGSTVRVDSPREFRHNLSTVVNGLVAHGFVLLGAWEDCGPDPDAVPGTWNHLMAVTAPYLTFWAAYRPYVFGRYLGGQYRFSDPG